MSDESAVFEGLNDQQREAVDKVTGPVRILAGAGSGKTTTITRRIANQVAIGAFKSSEILAVTFTDKAASEMVSRLATLKVDGVRTKTFHAEAWSQYRGLSGDEAQELLASKVAVLASLVRALPMPYKFTAVRDVATEIEWAKNQMITPGNYIDRLGEHEPPIPPDLVQSIYKRYESRKLQARLMDFEDLLAKTHAFLIDNPAVLARVRDRYRALTVDEYQDVNILQQSILDVWLGDRQEICVVGDDYQSIYGFTGATPRYLLDFTKRFPNAFGVELTLNYRSTQPILDLSNGLVPFMKGSSKILKASSRGIDTPVFQQFLEGAQELEGIVEAAKSLHAEGIAWDQMAVLYRINARSNDFESAFSKAKIPYQVADSGFLRRPGPREAIRRLRRLGGDDVERVVEGVVTALGFTGDGGGLGEEATRQADLERLLALAQEFESQGSVQDFVEDVVSRFGGETDGRGVQLLTYHRSKGKEYEAVFLPRLEQGELPFALARGAEQIAEERRLFYVGITRAKRRLFLSWALYRENEKRSRPQPSQFLLEIKRDSLPHPAQQPKPARQRREIPEGDTLFKELRGWRKDIAAENQLPAFVVFHDSVLISIAEQKPKTKSELAMIKGIGPAKLEKYADAIIDVVNRCEDLQS